MRFDYGMKRVSSHPGYGKNPYSRAVLEYNQDVEDLCRVAMTCCFLSSCLPKQFEPA